MWSMKTDEEIVVLYILLYATSQPCNVYDEICETVPTSLLSRCPERVTRSETRKRWTYALLRGFGSVQLYFFRVRAQ